MGLRRKNCAILGALGAIGLAALYVAADFATPVHSPPSSLFDRIVVIVLENYRPSEVNPDAIGPEQLTPFLNKLARENRVATNYFGVWKPSLPNYIAMIGGDFFGIGNNKPSCYGLEPRASCNQIVSPNIVDQLEDANIAWEGLFESMPKAGFLGAHFPYDTKLYAQKHNPFAYFKNVAIDPNRLAKLKPFTLDALIAELADATTASRFIFLVPNQCNDQHGTVGCKPDEVALAAGDAFLAITVPAIINAPAFTDRSVLFIAWDNSGGDEACCGRTSGGGRIPLIAITKHARPLRVATSSDHYSLLATIEDGFGLRRLGHAANASTLFDLFPDLRGSPTKSN
jgi:phosphatidylinositol-3-phosphatase